MSRLRRVDIVSITRIGFRRGLGVQVAGRAPRLWDCRDGVLKDELFLRSGFKEYRKLIETSNTARQFRAVEKIDDHRGLLSAHRVEKSVLNILRCLFAVRHVEKSGGGILNRAVVSRLQHGSLPDKRLAEDVRER